MTNINGLPEPSDNVIIKWEMKYTINALAKNKAAYAMYQISKFKKLNISH